MMAGAYCQYCDQRCFVYREVIVGDELVWSGHMATCPRGREHDREALGVDCDQARNALATCGLCPTHQTALAAHNPE